MESYLSLRSASGAPAALEGPALPSVDNRLAVGSVAFFNTVFILDKTFPNPFFPLGVVPLSGAGVLMVPRLSCGGDK